jgi:cell division protein FtsL
MSSYLIFALAQIISIILTPILGGIQNKAIVLWVLVGVSAIGTIEAFIYQGKTKRVEHETTVLEAKQVERALRKVRVEESGALGEEVVFESVGGVELSPAVNMERA